MGEATRTWRRIRGAEQRVKDGLVHITADQARRLIELDLSKIPETVWARTIADRMGQDWFACFLYAVWKAHHEGYDPLAKWPPDLDATYEPPLSESEIQLAIVTADALFFLEEGRRRGSIKYELCGHPFLYVLHLGENRTVKVIAQERDPKSGDWATIELTWDELIDIMAAFRAGVAEELEEINGKIH